MNIKEKEKKNERLNLIKQKKDEKNTSKLINLEEKKKKFKSLKSRCSINENRNSLKEDIFRYSKLLGIDPINDKELMWLVMEGFFAPLPIGWKIYTTKKGELFYFNKSENKSVWEHPLDQYFKMISRKEVEKKRRKKLKTRILFSKTTDIKPNPSPIFINKKEKIVNKSATMVNPDLKITKTVTRLIKRKRRKKKKKRKEEQENEIKMIKANSSNNVIKQEEKLIPKYKTSILSIKRNENVNNNNIEDFQSIWKKVKLNEDIRNLKDDKLELEHKIDLLQIKIKSLQKQKLKGIKEVKKNEKNLIKMGKSISTMKGLIKDHQMILNNLMLKKVKVKCEIENLNPKKISVSSNFEEEEEEEEEEIEINKEKMSSMIVDQNKIEEKKNFEDMLRKLDSQKEILYQLLQKRSKKKSKKK